MWMYVCTYECICEMYVKCMYVGIPVYMFVCMYVCMFVYVLFTYMYVYNECWYIDKLKCSLYMK